MSEKCTLNLAVKSVILASTLVVNLSKLVIRLSDEIFWPYIFFPVCKHTDDDVKFLSIYSRSLKYKLSRKPKWCPSIIVVPDIDNQSIKIHDCRIHASSWILSMFTLGSNKMLFLTSIYLRILFHTVLSSWHYLGFISIANTEKSDQEITKHTLRQICTINFVILIPYDTFVVFEFDWNDCGCLRIVRNTMYHILFAVT